MHISQLLQAHRPSISFEFFPPKTSKSAEELYLNIQGLLPFEVDYVSVTYGAGGSTRELTRQVVTRLIKETKLTVIPHLTCVGHSNEEIEAILSDYVNLGVENIMALRGDPPKGEINFTPHPNGPKYASDLVNLIKKKFPKLGIGVAGFCEGHPETPNRLQEMDYLKRKVDCGADYICTQLFFDNRDFYDFCERCEINGINIPIVAGIMPITSLKSLKRMSELALGTRFPAKLLRVLSRAHSDDYVRNVGIHWAAEQVMDLVDHRVRGIHIYTLNKALETQQIYQTLGVIKTNQLRERRESPSFLV